MTLNDLKPRKALNKAFLKVKPNRTDIEGFKAHLITLLDRTNDTESEEFHKNLVSDFLKDTYYKQNHFINTKGRNDLVIHNGPNANSTVGVILEAKKPTNKAEMLTTKKLNVKAFQELVLYYLRERITHKNLEVKYLVATNINEWFIFDATLFDRLFAQNKNLVKQFTDFESGRLANNKTDFFYKQIAEPFIAELTADIEFTYFNIQDYQKPLRNTDKADDNSLIALFKLLSPEHLLKLPFTNDSNSLDKRFYSELLHIIGLTETKEGSKKLIERHKEGQRNTGTLLENAIIQLDSLDKLNRLEKPNQFGNSQQERLFNVALELAITWINRILFLKLLEAQLITYHKGDKSYSFLNLDKIKNYDDLNSLFFQVLARKYEERNEDVKQPFAQVPYLNSSLFEPTDIEQVTLFISNLRDDKNIPIISSTVLKDGHGKKRTGKLSTLEYLFEFLNAYDFSSEGSEEIQEDNKTLINASVLGLIFEKINGYKDGSFFTPGFITMYMCRETIRKAVVQKFNETKKWNCSTIEELYDKIEDRKEANQIVNSIKICDPAVGSGHFLVSALNEIIAIKNDLRILQDREGKRLKEYQVEVVNDELIVTDEEGELFEYNPNNKESQRIQETLFNEKQNIIENCLFGVDINSNSVKICRLRLWIELLKNAYYKNATELETLPNIDINIKCGNSLVSRFAIDSNLKQALKKSKYSINNYRIAVSTYRNAADKDQKKEMERLIADIKSDFRSEISKNDPKIKKLQNLEYEYGLLVAPNIFKEDMAVYGSNSNKKKAKDRELKMFAEIQKLKAEIEDIKANKIFENAFEWRFEFPEVLNNDGDFVGFDVIIGNPPYGVKLEKNEIQFIKENFETSSYQIDTYITFVELGVNIMVPKAQLCYIIPKAWYASVYDFQFRKFIFGNNLLNRITVCPEKTFEEAVVETSIISLEKDIKSNVIMIYDLEMNILNAISLKEILENDIYTFDPILSNIERQLTNRLRSGYSVVGQFFDVIWGVKIYQKGKGNPRQTEQQSIDKSFHSDSKIDSTYKKLIGGKNIERFHLNWSGIYIKYGEWLAEPRTPQWFNDDYIIYVREVTSGGKIIATLNNGEYVFSNSVDGIRSINNDIDSMYQLTGILNSSLAQFYHLNVSSNSQKGAFPKVLVKNIKDFPYPEKISSSLVAYIKSIIEAKLIDSNSEYSVSKINQLVYKLYELSDEEIAIIENSIN